MGNQFVRANRLTKRMYANMFRKAAKLLMKGGWTKGAWVGWSMDLQPCYCVGGAINKVTVNVPSGCVQDGTMPNHMFMMLYELLGMDIRDCWAPLASWNDNPNRTKAHVVSLLRLAARKLDHGWTPKYWAFARVGLDVSKIPF